VFSPAAQAEFYSTLKVGPDRPVPTTLHQFTSPTNRLPQSTYCERPKVVSADWPKLKFRQCPPITKVSFTLLKYKRMKILSKVVPIDHFYFYKSFKKTRLSLNITIPSGLYEIFRHFWGFSAFLVDLFSFVVSFGHKWNC
jgi:hypothetical protein